MISLNNDWTFTPEFTPDFINGEGGGDTVRIPHTVKVLPYHYADDKDYQMISGYRKRIFVPVEWKGKRLFLRFEAAAHIATVYRNGKELTTHYGGYTAFSAEITEEVNYGEYNLVAVRLDSTENPSIPPFGYVIDYLTYGGIYRPVWLDIREKEYIEDIFVKNTKENEIEISVATDPLQGLEKTYYIRDQKGELVYEKTTQEDSLTVALEDAHLWDTEDPYLYTLEVKLEGGDEKSVSFGFRSIAFTPEGFFLNGKKTFIYGLDRHQCFPYLGYAVSDSLQREDARILKEELSCNGVRTSHYPQSHAFLDECDKRGLLVFTEIPGWQHIGGEEWKAVACENVREMVTQYRNHPSIVLWGVRINESQDDDEFYTRTNAIAHELDPSRPTSGVRYIKNSSLLEDVYSFNDFSHTGNNAGVLPKKEVTKHSEKPLIISEANGHMFPTKPYDTWEKRQSHALRHARVLNDAMADGEHVGCYQWCMFDYATHKDFGSGDRICYHGVMDGFRNPKLAAYTYASQRDDTNVLEVGSSMDIGDYPGGNVSEVYVFTNADHVKLYKNGQFVAVLDKTPFKALPHGPILVDDTIGELLKTNEGFEGEKNDTIHDLLLSAKKYGIDDMPLKDKLKLGLAVKKYSLDFETLKDLYNRYVGNWGGEVTVWRFDAIRNGEIVASKTLSPNAKLHLEVKVSSETLKEGDTYDMAAVRVRILDANGNIAPFAQYPCRFEVEGPLELVSPQITALEGGMTGAYLKTTGEQGNGKIRVFVEDLPVIEKEITVIR